VAVDDRASAARPGTGRWPAVGYPAVTADTEDELLDQLFDAVLMRDPDTDVITRWSAGAAQLYGWTSAEAVGRAAAELLRSGHPAPRAELDEELRRRGRWEGTTTQVGRDGRERLVATRWLLRRQQPSGPAAVVEIHRDSGPPPAPSQSELSYRHLVSSVRDFAVFMLDPTGIIVTWNDGARRIKGYAADDIIGRHFSVFYEPADVASGKPDRELATAEREGRFEDEGWRVRKDGRRFWSNAVITALRDDAGQLRGFAKVTRDMTEHKAAEERRLEEERTESRRLREHGDQMAQLEKLKSDFLNLASHELRGPLAVVKGYVSMFEDHTMEPDELPSILPLLGAKIQEIELLVQQMLETARLEEDRLALHPERFDLRGIAERVIARFRATISNRYELRLSIPDRPVMVEADRGRIETVVANLVDNAIKYSPSGGVVSCTVENLGERILVRVEDTGVGVATTSIEQLFRRFSRILTPETAHVGGTGLGLYICREIARRHRGDILIESKEGQGSRFTLALPR
jgi:PAS domain S-box-containing protein